MTVHTSSHAISQSLSEFSRVFVTIATFSSDGLHSRVAGASESHAVGARATHAYPLHAQAVLGALKCGVRACVFFVRRSLLRLNRFNKSAHPGIIKPQKRESARGICWRNLPRKFKHESRIFMRTRKLALATNPPRLVHNQATRRACCGCIQPGAEKDTGDGHFRTHAFRRSQRGTLLIFAYFKQ
jgi:hypothetical protein